MTSAFSIIPKLGFRMVALSSTPDILNERNSISPFLSLLFATKLDHLESRVDFKEILDTKFKFVQALSWIQTFMLECVDFMQAKMNKYKGQLLDHKPFSVKQIFKAFQRVDNLLSKIVDLNDKEGSYVSSDTAQSIILDISDVFLAHVYDKNVKADLLFSLIAEAYNPFCQKHDQVQLDPQEFLDFAVQNTRQYGINDHSYVFGRAQPVPREKVS